MLVHLNVWSAARARHPVTADLRRRRAVGDQAPVSRAADLLAADEGVLLADGASLRDPRLSSARVLLHGRLLQLPDRLRARHVTRSHRHFSGHPPTPGLATIVALMMNFSLFVHAVRDVVRHGDQQGPEDDTFARHRSGRVHGLARRAPLPRAATRWSPSTTSSGGFARTCPTAREFVEGSISDAGLVDGLFARARFDYVYHLAAYAAEGPQPLHPPLQLHEQRRRRDQPDQRRRQHRRRAASSSRARSPSTAGPDCR